VGKGKTGNYVKIALRGGEKGVTFVKKKRRGNAAI
jgi:hypothetical protein